MTTPHDPAPVAKRGTIDGYASPWPLIDHLPGLYQDDALTR